MAFGIHLASTAVLLGLSLSDIPVQARVYMAYPSNGGGGAVQTSTFVNTYQPRIAACVAGFIQAIYHFWTFFYIDKVQEHWTKDHVSYWHWITCTLVSPILVLTVAVQVGVNDLNVLFGLVMSVLASVLCAFLSEVKDNPHRALTFGMNLAFKFYPWFTILGEFILARHTSAAPNALWALVIIELFFFVIVEPVLIYTLAFGKYEATKSSNVVSLGMVKINWSLHKEKYAAAIFSHIGFWIATLIILNWCTYSAGQVPQYAAP